MGEEDGEFTINREKDIIFVVSNTPKLKFMQMSADSVESLNFDESHKGPQAFLLPYEESTNVMETHLTKIQTLDDMPIEEY